eukprot:5922634-Amphidinium_carterae.1
MCHVGAGDDFGLPRFDATFSRLASVLGSVSDGSSGSRSFGSIDKGSGDSSSQPLDSSLSASLKKACSFSPAKSSKPRVRALPPTMPTAKQLTVIPDDETTLPLPKLRKRVSK